jgi:hypothetical protein
VPSTPQFVCGPVADAEQVRKMSSAPLKKVSVTAGVGAELPRNALGQLLKMDNTQDEHFKQLLKEWS